MTTTAALARRLRRLERLHGGVVREDAGWTTQAEQQVLNQLEREPALPADVRELAAEAIAMLGAARRAGLPRPQVAHAGPPPEVLELIEAARRELQLDLVDGQR
jgi:hypothetical protein